jgi:unsaturated chondroitin disaccharide hydrolase
MTSSGDATATDAQTAGVVAVADCWAFAERQLRRLLRRAPGQTPTYTENGRWVLNEDPWAPTWSGGFLAGMLWILAARTGDAWWREQAEWYSRLLEPRKHDTGTHDIGFVLEPSWGRWYDLEPHGHAREVLVDGGRTMAGRLQLPGGYLRTWVDPGSTFIDVMMNVGIIFRAARYSDDPALRDAALRHAHTSRRFLMRGDGSTAHEAWFDPQTGEFLRTATHQGWRSDSTWARGQAWAIYGFTVAHRHTGDEALLDAACRAADFYIAATPAGQVPPNDWSDPAPPEPWESSAAAIATAGMFRLAAVLGAGERRDRYRDYAKRSLRTLRTPEFLAVGTSGWEGIVKHAIYHRRNGLGIDESVMFGDYYFLDALDLAEHFDEGEEEP